jgi:SRSO17 transposase
MRLIKYIPEYQFLLKTKTKSLFDQAEQYFKGLFQSDKRNIERMCETVPESNYERIQHFISSSPWDALAVMNKVAENTSKSLQKFTKVGLLVDESGHSKKGDKSVGVGWQYNGNTGKVENCQVGVYAALCANQYYSLVDSRLYLPKDWTEDKARCLEAGIPEERIIFKTKPELALEIVKSLRELGIRFDWVDADGLYGNDFEFADALDQLGEVFVLEVHSNQKIYLEEPEIHIPKDLGKKGRKPSLPKSKQQSVQVRQYVAGCQQSYWNEFTIRETTKGPLRCQALVRKIWVWDGESLKAKERLLIIKKTKISNGFEYKYALTNAKENQFSWEDLIQMQSQRYFIERAFQESKQELGMSDYQVRGWRAWHHHTALVMMAQEFVLREKLLCQDTVPLLSTRDVRELIIIQLISKKRNLLEILKQILQRHRKRKQAIDNFYQKKLQI